MKGAFRFSVVTQDGATIVIDDADGMACREHGLVELYNYAGAPIAAFCLPQSVIRSEEVLPESEVSDPE